MFKIGKVRFHDKFASRSMIKLGVGKGQRTMKMKQRNRTPIVKGDPDWILPGDGHHAG